jgi:hypothetical protein
MKTEINLSDHYMKDVVLLLSKLSRYKNNKSFEDLTREDIPNGVVKSGNSDLLHKWIGTYNIYRRHLPVSCIPGNIDLISMSCVKLTINSSTT